MSEDNINSMYDSIYGTHLKNEHEEKHFTIDNVTPEELESKLNELLDSPEFEHIRKTLEEAGVNITEIRTRIKDFSEGIPQSKEFLKGVIDDKDHLNEVMEDVLTDEIVITMGKLFIPLGVYDLNTADRGHSIMKAMTAVIIHKMEEIGYRRINEEGEASPLPEVQE